MSVMAREFALRFQCDCVQDAKARFDAQATKETLELVSTDGLLKLQRKLYGVEMREECACLLKP